VYGNNKPHCWAGDIPSGMTLQQYYLPIFAEHMAKMAPRGSGHRKLAQVTQAILSACGF
jgi:hypothetical protein